MRRVSAIGNRKVRLLIVEGLSIILLLVFSLSVKVSPTVPAFSGSEGEIDPGLRTASVFDFLWIKDDLAKEVLRLGFPMLRYAEVGRYDTLSPLREDRRLFNGVHARSARPWPSGFSGFLLKAGDETSGAVSDRG